MYELLYVPENMFYRRYEGKIIITVKLTKVKIDQNQAPMMIFLARYISPNPTKYLINFIIVAEIMGKKSKQFRNNFTV